MTDEPRPDGDDVPVEGAPRPWVDGPPTGEIPAVRSGDGEPAADESVDDEGVVDDEPAASDYDDAVAGEERGGWFDDGGATGASAADPAFSTSIDWGDPPEALPPLDADDGGVWPPDEDVAERTAATDDLDDGEVVDDSADDEPTEAYRMSWPAPVAGGAAAAGAYSAADRDVVDDDDLGPEPSTRRAALVVLALGAAVVLIVLLAVLAGDDDEMTQQAATASTVTTVRTTTTERAGAAVTTATTAQVTTTTARPTTTTTARPTTTTTAAATTTTAGAPAGSARTPRNAGLRPGEVRWDRDPATGTFTGDILVTNTTRQAVSADVTVLMNRNRQRVGVMTGSVRALPPGGSTRVPLTSDDQWVDGVDDVVFRARAR